MGVLKHISSGRSIVLAPHTVGGRAPSSVVRLFDQAASNDHASVSWTGERWEVRDLGSTNGTSIDGAPVRPKENAPLTRGAVVRFGCDAERWELVDDRGPVVVVRSLATGELRAAEDGLLALPGPDEVLVSIVMDSAGRWFVETPDGARRPASDREKLTVAGETWELSVPPASPVAGTYKAKAGLSLGTLSMRFFVSRDEEHVRIEMVDGETVLPLKERPSFYLLLLLARERREDAAKEGLPDSEHGWYDVVDLAHDLGTDEKSLNVTVHRLRDAFAKARGEGAEGIIERRARQLRIGTGRLEEIKA